MSTTRHRYAYPVTGSRPKELYAVVPLRVYPVRQREHWPTRRNVTAEWVHTFVGRPGSTRGLAADLRSD